MTSLFDIVTDPVLDMMKSLEDDLKGTLSCIAYTDDCDLDFIKKRGEDLINEYDDKINNNNVRIKGLGFPGDLVNWAYDAFRIIIDDLDQCLSEDYDVCQIKKDCENILGDYLELPLDGFNIKEQEEILYSLTMLPV